ncbi:hypothetical protein ECANGB1_836 [Enterospora canceri]|uniref:J domain-containing protein n=1 Tax=Enterospora canceri TaxID=1081671 RepID=A0A1Y1S7B9_9MICR|nr:hypothetical protein ECANGB1_836 [Enterospora canceri]
MKLKHKIDVFNPYAVLGIDEDTSIKKAKKMYKKMLRPLYQQAKHEDQKKEAEKQIMVLNKAFDLIKDPVNYQNFIDSQTKSELFVAMPKFIVDFGVTSFSLYVLFLAVVIPGIIYAFIRKTGSKTSKGAEYVTVDRFYEECGGIRTEYKKSAFYELLVFISEAADLKNAYKTDLTSHKDFYRKALEDVGRMPLFCETNEFLHITDFLCRTNKATEEEQVFTQHTAIRILDNYQDIAFYRNKELYDVVCDTKRVFYQRILLPEFVTMQILPIENNLDLLEKVAVFDATKEPLEEFLGKQNCLSADDVASAKKLRASEPKIRVNMLKAFTYDEKLLNDENTTNYDKVEMENKFFKVDKDTNVYVSFEIETVGDYEMIHAPFYNKPVPFGLEVTCKLNNTMFGKEIYLNNPRNEPIKVQLPEMRGVAKMEVLVRVQGILGCDVRETIKIRFL